jgi:hypothetical protein
VTAPAAGADRPVPCPERRFQDITHALNGAFGTFTVLNAPFMTPGMSRTRLSWQGGAREPVGEHGEHRHTETREAAA